MNILDPALSGGELFFTLMMVLISIKFLPEAVWDAESGRYGGYFSREALSILMLVAIMGGLLSISQGKPGPDVLADVGFYLFVATLSSRLYVEWAHHHKFNRWLRHQYHKMTDHEDPRA